MNSVIKSRGIYPTYIGQMNNLQCVLVDIELRLLTTWDTYTKNQYTYDELFSEVLSLSLTRFETSITDIA